MEGTHAIDMLRIGDDASLSRLYKQHRSQFSAWVRKQPGIDEDTCGSLYQEAFLIMFEHVRSGKLHHLDSAVGTYLIGIGKNLIKSRRGSSWAMRVDKLGIQSELFDSNVQLEEPTPEIEKLAFALEKLSDKCRGILILYYYQSFSMEAIALRLGFKNEAVAKKSKYECLQKLKQNYREV